MKNRRDYALKHFLTKIDNASLYYHLSQEDLKKSSFLNDEFTNSYILYTLNFEVQNPNEFFNSLRDEYQRMLLLKEEISERLEFLERLSLNGVTERGATYIRNNAKFGNALNNKEEDTIMDSGNFDDAHLDSNNEERLISKLPQEALDFLNRN